MDAVHVFPSLRGRQRGGAFGVSGRLTRDAMDLGVTQAKSVGDVAAPGPRVKLHVRGISKAYGSSIALQPMELMVYSGELLALLGPSGSGKTTLLQIICGLAEPSGGRLMIDGRDETDNSASKRDVGVVFQNYALFPHLTVRENVSFPLQMRRTAASELRVKVDTTLAMVGLSGFGDRFPQELSGGQQQRVALARCLVYQPSLILMDESLSALDRKLRDSMRIEIKRLHRDTGATIIFVTHDQEEALALADRICLINEGRIEQLGTPEEIYEQPRNAFVAEFIGISNMMHGRIEAGMSMRTEDGALPLPAGCARRTGDSGVLVIRPEKIAFCSADEALVSGQVEESIYAGSETKLLVRLRSGSLMTVRRQAGLPRINIGENVWLRWDKDQARLLAHDPEKAGPGLDPGWTPVFGKDHAPLKT
jgi:putative spermidine/putrescine transport system ATP-binding protein